MKKILFLFILLLNCFLAHSTEPVVINLGTVPYKGSSDTTYQFDVQKVTYAIQNVEIKCPCTKVTWDKRPIVAGAKGTIKITYRGLEPGIFYKTIYVTTSNNTQKQQIIIRGKVE